MLNQKNEVNSPLGFSKKCLVSILVLLHFFAILTAVTSSGNGPFKAPVLATELNRPFKPYLDTLFLQSSYRFFAPNPGPTNVVWFRLSYADGRSRWYEFPRHEGYRAQIAYSRMLSLTELGTQVEDAPQQPGQVTLNADTQVCVSSFVRHVAARQSQDSSNVGKSSEIQTVEVFRVGHSYIMPDQIRAGWDYTDLRLYQPIYLGSFRPDGSQTDENAAAYCDIEVVVADMIKNDVAPVLLSSQSPGNETSPKQLADLGIPEPVRVLIERHPQVVSLSSAEIVKQMQVALNGEHKSDRSTISPEVDVNRNNGP